MIHPSFCVKHLEDKLWIVAVLNNPCRYKKRYQLFREFLERMKKYDVRVCVVECSYGELCYEIEDSLVELKVNVTTKTILWQKENLINIGISRLPVDWKYVAWIDADIDFVRPDWVQETIHQLQHHYVVQLFEDCVDLGPKQEILKTNKSFMYCYKNHVQKAFQKSIKNCYNTETVNGGTYWHPGYAFACTRHFIDTVGGLLETAILGSGDHHMCCALIGAGDGSLPSQLSQDYKNSVLDWETRALRLHRNVGYVGGMIYHFWHGKKANRKYKERWQILIDNNFQPSRDLYKNSQGVLIFYEGNYNLRDQIHEYFHQRDEDDITL